MKKICIDPISVHILSKSRKNHLKLGTGDKFFCIDTKNMETPGQTHFFFINLILQNYVEWTRGESIIECKTIAARDFSLI